jgi:hypothetical protein
LGAKVKGPAGANESEVSIFACMVWKLETSGNENGNECHSVIQNCDFVGKNEHARKRTMRGFVETSRHFLGVEVSINGS